MVECKFCELAQPFRLFEEHVDACDSRTDFCERCNKRVMLKNMDEHLEFKCGQSDAPPIASNAEDLANMSAYAEGEPDATPPFLNGLRLGGMLLPGRGGNNLDVAEPVHGLGRSNSPTPLYAPPEGEEKGLARLTAAGEAVCCPRCCGAGSLPVVRVFL